MSSFRACARLDLFQPTLPARGATAATARNVDDGVISTHAPRTGSDALSAVFSGVSENFNPRSPHGERLTFSPPTSPISSISTHAPRTGSDKKCLAYFFCYSSFQPTLPARGATTCSTPRSGSAIISTHAPRTGSDFAGRQCFRHVGEFQPTLPARGATQFRRCGRLCSVQFQPTLPARGATGIEVKRPNGT